MTGNADLTNSLLLSTSIFLERRSREGDEEKDIVIYHYLENTFKHYDILACDRTDGCAEVGIFTHACQQSCI